MKLPKHVAIILDGNRRWALRKGMITRRGHEAGAKRFEDILNFILQMDIPKISVYALSIENLKRTKLELNSIYSIGERILTNWLEDGKFLEKYDVQVNFYGDFSKLPRKILSPMYKLMKKTSSHKKKRLNIMIAYGGKYEIAEAVKKIINKVERKGQKNRKITEKDIEKNLFVKDPVDLLIRTGGHSRLSNFMLWQAAYADIYSTRTLWPDFSKKEFLKALKFYEKSKRNFGR